MIKRFLSLLFLLIAITSHTQVSFKAELLKDDPIQENDTFDFSEVIKIHKNYLAQAFKENNKKRIIFGYLFLFYDNYDHQKYTECKELLKNAEEFAIKNSNFTWRGVVELNKGILNYSIENDSLQNAIYNFEKAIEYCGKSKDSVCVAESLEQLSAMYTYKKDYELAHQSYKIAIPLLRKFLGDSNLYTAFNNYSNLFSAEGDLFHAKVYLDSAIDLIKKTNDIYRQTLYQGNMAFLLRDMGRFDESIQLSLNCLKVNEEHNWGEQMLTNLDGIRITYEEMGDYKKAYSYLQKYKVLDDSLLGIDVQIKLKDLDSKYESEKKMLELLQLKSKNEKLILILISGLAISILLFWLWYREKLSKKSQHRQHLENLNRMTRLLQIKNEKILNLEGDLTQKQDELENSFQSNLSESHDFLNHTILTEEDWTSFKSYFEKVYPNYILQLRSKYPNLTEAEERLFLFIKLNIKTKEAAAILGISPDSVKKTKTRLKKKLELSEEIDLTTFIQCFNSN